MANYGDWTAFSWNAPSVFYRNRATAANNIPHMFQLGYVYELPFGKGKKWATSGVSSGDPRRLAVQRHLQRLPGTAVHAHRLRVVAEYAGQRADSRPGQARRSKSSAWWVTMAPGSTPRAFARPTGVRFGNVGRNTMRGPGVVNTDLSLFRTFKITERLNLQFRAESFNLSNTPHFANPNGNANSSLFGRITATQSNADAVGKSREYRLRACGWASSRESCFMRHSGRGE